MCILSYYEKSTICIDAHQETEVDIEKYYKWYHYQFTKHYQQAIIDKSKPGNLTFGVINT